MAMRKCYTKEFKQDAVRLVTGYGYSQTEVARNLGIKANMLGRGFRSSGRMRVKRFVGTGSARRSRKSCSGYGRRIAD